MKRDQYWLDRDWCAWLECWVVFFATSFNVALLHLWFLGLVWWEWNTSITESQRSRAGIPSTRKPASREIISAFVELCETEEVCFLHIQLISTNVWLPTMHRTLLMLILRLKNIRQSQSLETIRVCIVSQCYPHKNIAGIHLYDECTRSSAPSVCHKILSILWPHEHFSQTIKYQISQYKQITKISEKFVSRLLTILELVQFLLL